MRWEDDPPVRVRGRPAERGLPRPTRRRRLGCIALVIGGVLAITALLAVCTGDGGPEDAPSAEIQRFVVGTGAQAALVVRTRGSGPQPAVIFLHGWRLLGREAYRAWFAHLARRGATVIAPRYQLRSGTAPEDALDNALAGVRAALQRVPVLTDAVTVAGHSAGGALAADYAAVAARESLPRPRSALVIYPGRAIRGSVAGIPAADLSQIPPTTRLVVMASAADRVVGDMPARELFAAATAIPRERRTFVSVEEPRAADHFAPVLSTPTARRVFWRQLDRLVAIR